MVHTGHTGAYNGMLLLLQRGFARRRISADGKSFNRKGSCRGEVKERREVRETAAELSEIDAKRPRHALAQHLSDVSDVHVAGNVEAHLSKK